MKDVSKRIGSLDLVRFLAIILVLLCHTTQVTYGLPKASEFNNWTTIDQFMCFSSFTLGRFGVPFFLFLTGSLVLNKKYTKNKFAEFYKNKFLKLLTCILTWILLYNIFLIFMNLTSFSLKDIVEEFIYIKYIELPHYWYLPTIIGIYLFIPFVSKAIFNTQTKWIVIVASVAVCYFFILPSFNDVRMLLGQTQIIHYIDLGFSGGAFGTYVVIGYLIKERKLLRKIPSVILLILVFTILAALIYSQYYIYSKSLIYDLPYENIFLLATSSIIFELLLRCKLNKTPLIIKIIAKYSFGIYLTHYLIIIISTNMINALKLPLIPTNIFWLLFIMVVSCAFVWATSKIPKIGKFIYYLK